MDDIRRLAHKRAGLPNPTPDEVWNTPDMRVKIEERQIIATFLDGSLIDNFLEIRQRATEMLKSTNEKEQELGRRILEDITIQDFINEEGSDEEGFVDKFLRKNQS